MTQEFESEQGCAAQHTTAILISQQDEDSRLGFSEGIEREGQPYQTCHDAAEETVPEQAGDVLPVTTSTVGVPAGTCCGPDDSAPQRKGRPSRQAAQVAATLISQQLDTPNYRSPKRKHVPEVSDDSNSALATASDAAVAGTEGHVLDTSRLRESSSSPIANDNSQDKQVHFSGSDQGSIPTIPAGASLNLPESVSNPMPSTQEARPSSSDALPTAFADLREELRVKGPMIGNKETVEHLWYIFHYMRGAGPSQASAWSNHLEEIPLTLATDERNRMLGTYITREELSQEQLRIAKSLPGLRKRLYLVELIGNYSDEHDAWEAWKAVPRSKRRKTEGPRSPLNRYIDVLFPETKDWKGARPGETEASKAARAALRDQAKNKLEYWISLGKPLVKLARQHGVGILGGFPKEMNDTL